MSPTHRLPRRPLCAPFLARLAALSLGTLALTAPMLAAAQSPQAPAGLSGSIGIGVASMPTYRGSPNRRTLAGPDLSLSYRSADWGTIDFGPQGLMWSPAGDGALRYGLVGAIDLGRLDRAPTRSNPTPGDARLAGMGKVERSLEAGAFVGFGPLTLTARNGLGSKGHGGTRVDIALSHGFELSETLGVSVEARAEWADRKYMKAYYGLIPTVTIAPPLVAYEAQNGWVQHSLTVGADWEFMPKWHARFALTGSYVGDEAAKSPLVVKRKATTAGLSVVYAF